MSETVPPGWTQAKLGELVVEVRNGISAKPDADAGTPILRISAVRPMLLNASDIRFLDGPSSDWALYQLRTNDLLFTRYNGNPSLVGVCARVSLDGEQPLVYPDKLIRVRLDERLALPAFIEKAVHVGDSRAFIDGKSKTSAGQVGISGGDLKEVPVLLAPLNEQRRIIAKVEALQSCSRRAREALEAVAPLLEKLRHSILAAAFRGDLTKDWRAKNPDVEPASELLKRIRAERQSDSRLRGRHAVAAARAAGERPENIPGTWAVASLGDVAPLQPGYAFKSSEFTTEGVRLLRGTNIVPDSTRWEDVVHLEAARVGEFAEYALNAGDIVIAMDRPIISSGIKVARLASTDVPALLLQRVGRFRVGEAIDAAYLFHFLRSIQFTRHISGQATGTQLPHISGTDVGAVLVPIPPLNEQAAIAERCDAALRAVAYQTAVCAGIGRAHEKLDRAILAKAFRGELAFQDPADEPANVMLARVRGSEAPAEEVPRQKAPKRASAERRRRA